MLSELPPTNPSIRNPRYPISRSSVDGGVNEFNCFGSFLTLSFHRNWKPGFCPGFCRMDSFEIFASRLIQDERCASPLSVIQSEPGRWAFASPAQATTQAKQPMNTAASLLIAETPLNKYFSSATFKIMLVDHAHDCLCNFSAALFRRFYLVGIVRIFVAHKPQINQRDARLKRLPDYHVIENCQRGDRYFLHKWFWYSRVIDCTNDGWFFQSQDCLQHFAVMIFELAGYIRKPIQNLHARCGFLPQNVGLQSSVVSAHADNEMRRVIG